MKKTEAQLKEERLSLYKSKTTEDLHVTLLLTRRFAHEASTVENAESWRETAKEIEAEIIRRVYESPTNERI